MPARSTARALAGLLFVGLAGCSVGDENLTARERALRERAFEKVTAEVVGPLAERTFRRDGVSRKELTWGEADATLAALLGPPCVDGEDFETLARTPSYDPATFFTAKLPAGTPFGHTYRCAAPYDGEIALAPEESIEDATRRVEALVGAGGEVIALGFDDRERKYPAIEAWLGDRLADALRRCDAAAVVTGPIVVAGWPAARNSAPRPTGTVVVGTTFACVDPPPRDR